MSPYSLLVIYAGRSTGPGTTASLPVTEAGRVAMPPGTHRGRDLFLELLHAGSYLENGFPRWEISRKKSLEDIGQGLLLPQGPAIGALWDRKARRYHALSRPFEVEARKTVEVPLERPEGAAHLILQLQRQGLASTAADLDIDITLHLSDGKELPPDLEIPTANRVYAVWYGLAPGAAEVRAESKDEFLEPQQLRFAAGRIERHVAQLRPRPALDVELNLPTALRHERLALELRRLPSRQVVARGVLETPAHTHRFENLPPALLEVDLQTSLGSFVRQVDLSLGKDGFLLIEPELITVRGTVYHGDKGRPAKLAFTTAARTTTEVQTDDEGAYEVAVLQPLRFVAIELRGTKAAPYTDFFAPAIAESRELDFRLPDVTYRVQVLDAATRQGIPKASLALRNRYAFEDEVEGDLRGAGRGRERVIAQSATTDETGTAWLPPLRKGELEIRASAEGYSEMREPVRAQVVDGTTDQDFEVLLEPIGETVALHLRLPSGAPAAGAEVVLVDSLEWGLRLFEARASGGGMVRAPRAHVGILLVKHPAAAFLVREWRPREDESEAAWDLTAAAGRPLTIHVTESSGKSAAPRAELALWVGGRRLSGVALAWLTGTHPVADANGYWRATNLPPAPVGVLAWSLRLREEAWSGTLDAQATTTAFPWPDPIKVRVFD
ncbi:MAG: carboxypeptidase-like regulatory domain-containing protein [Anaerolineales bacterium]